MVAVTKAASLIVALFAFLIYVLHNAAPYLRLECVAFSMNCPIALSHGTIHDADGSDSIHLRPLKQIMQQWVRNGYSTATQLSVFIDDKERLNLFAKDAKNYPKFDQNSLLPLFSTSKSFAAMMMAIALQNQWIASFDDYVTDYWPQFPTQKMVISFDEYSAFYDMHSKNKSAPITPQTLRAYFEKEKGVKLEAHRVRIKDVLRHQGGFSPVVSDMPITFNSTSYQDIQRLVENTGYLIYFTRSDRSYHAISRAFLLNEIFMRVEPQHRSISDYFAQEIAAKISDKVLENEFFLKFDGLDNNAKDIERMYHIHQQPLHWSLYHVVLPIVLGFDAPFSSVFAKQLCPSTVMNESLCPQQSLATTKYFMNSMDKMTMGNFMDIELAAPDAFSQQFTKHMAAAYMSCSGIGNAHSVAKAASYVLFSGEVLSARTVTQIVAEKDEKFDVFLGQDTVFTDGFGYARVQGIDWYGWGGWGGSFMYFAPKYKCTVAFTVTAFNSPHYSLLDLPRSNTVLHLVSMQLLHDHPNL